MTGGAPIRVLLCEDSLGFRMLASAWLREDAAIELVGIAETGREALELAEQTNPHVVLLDHLLPDTDSSTLVAALRVAVPNVAIALMSGMPPGVLAAEAARSGAEAFCSKGVEPQRLLVTVRDAYAAGPLG